MHGAPRVLDLFSGIGGFALGLESVGMRTAAFCECEPYAVAVLRKHWPDTPVYPDVRRLDAAALRRDGVPPPDVICGGFPCQPFSFAGERRGTADERHLWPEFARLIGECRPSWVVAENVPGIRSLAADGVLSDLEALGYACWPVVVGAVHAGAPHQRQRVWFVACDPESIGRGSWWPRRSADAGEGSSFPLRPIQTADAARMHRLAQFRDEPDGDVAGVDDVADADSARFPDGRISGFQEKYPVPSSRSWWGAEPDVGRVAHGIPRRVDRLRCLGNAVVPQVVAMIGAWIMQQRVPS